MVGRVFISCGQRPGREQDITRKVSQLLMDKFHLESYVAINIQGLNDIMRITDELKRSDYYLFIDLSRKNTNFLRRKKDPFPVSMFTHQELALAHNLGFTDMIALKEKGTPIEGFFKYIQSNPIEFNGEQDLLTKIEALVRERGWVRDFSRNLVLESLGDRYGPCRFGDHTGAYNQYIWHVRIENRRPDIAAVNALCILDSITSGGRTRESPDRSNLKWARQSGFARTIFPQDYGLIDVIAIREDDEGLFLHSAMDVNPRDPIVMVPGNYLLNYKVFSQNFPVLQFSLEVDFHLSEHLPRNWINRTTVRMVNAVPI